MTIKSFYILNSLGKILFEHHYQTFNFSKSLIEYFCNYANLHGNLSLSQSKNTVKPVIDVPRFESTLIWLCRDQVYLVVRVDSDVPPLTVLTFLERFHSILLSYLAVSSLTESNVKENLTVIFEVITTLLDGGVPFVTDENLLTEIVKPVDVLSKVVSQVTGVVSAPDTPTPSSQLSTIPWRKFNPRYTSNEIYLDITESLDLIIERNGNVVPGGGVNGVVKCTSKLSGTPDVEVRFMGFGGAKTGWEEVGVHRCVRYSKWEREKALSFVPPDGTFELMSYRAPIASAQVLPIFLRPRITFSQDSGTIDITVSTRTTQYVIDNVSLSIYLPNDTNVGMVNMNSSVGDWIVDPVTKVLEWNIGRYPKDKSPTLKGTLTFDSTHSSSLHTRPTSSKILLSFTTHGMNVSGLKIHSVNILREGYKPYKGVRWATKSDKDRGGVEIRT